MAMHRILSQSGDWRSRDRRTPVRQITQSLRSWLVREPTILGMGL